TSASNEEILTGNINAATGAVNWFKKYSNPSGNDRGYDIETASSPDGYGVSGHLYTPASVSQDQFLMRTDLLGIITPGCVDALGLIQRPLQSVSDTLQLNYTQVQDIQINPTVISQAVTVRNLCGLTGVNENNNSIPETYKLEQNYPNPFNPSTTIKFSLPEDGKISLKVHDITGKVIANLEDGFKNKGNYSVEFNASNLPSGIYFYTLSAGRVTETKKMILIK
ncbi:MAG: T9SS C-terminal target domain-containing protein, partial [Ignavibacteriae bacterium]